MWRYIVAHWQGEQSLPRSVLLNWLLVYLLLVLLAGLVEIAAIRLPEPVVWAVFGAMLIWLVWAIVGVLRRGWRVLAAPDVSALRKVGAVVAVLGATVFAIVAGSDVYHILFARSVPRGAEVKAAMRHVPPARASARWISTRRPVEWAVMPAAPPSQASS